MAGVGEQQSSLKKWIQRVGWLIAIWLLSIASLALVAWGFRLLMRSAGFA